MKSITFKLEDLHGGYMKKLLSIIIAMSLTLSISGCSKQNPIEKSSELDTSAGIPKIQRNPPAAYIRNEKVTSLPKFEPKTPKEYTIDLVGVDLYETKLSDRIDDLLYASFSKFTRWPEVLPVGFNPSEIMEINKTPGLNIKQLHSQGITGNGVSIAIIDSTLLVNHIEYKDNLKLYEEINDVSKVAEFHGGMVSSIAVGNSVGVAPDSDLYYIAASPSDDNGNKTYEGYAKAIDRILEINRGLSEKNKIRVISISWGWIEGITGYQDIKNAVERAQKAGIFVVSSSLLGDYGLFFNGLGREPLKDPDLLSSYEPPIIYRNYYYKEDDINKFFEERSLETFKTSKQIDRILLVPMDSKTFASPYGTEDYIYSRKNEWSVCSPYIAGLYALASQVYSNITPELFWEIALKTGDSIIANNGNKRITIEKVVNPVSLFNDLKDRASKLK